MMGSAANGNYLGMLELLAQYDDFPKQHIQKHANLGSGHTNYLSSTICEELVQPLGKRVLVEIVSRINRSRYYSVTLNSTPDEGHVDQLTLVFRFIENTTPVERFVSLSNEFLKDADDNIGKEHFLYRLIIDKRVKCSFPNVEIALRMYLILMVTNCSGEHSFSKLKYVKNRLRTTMTNERVTHLSLMSIEYDILYAKQTLTISSLTLLNAKVEKCLVCRQ